MEAQEIIFIALLPKPADLERAQEGWYRVPVAHAPDALASARALAFYQPASFGKGRWQVAWWGEVTRVETKLRRELLPDEPNHRRAGDPYLCFHLAPLQPVEPPKRAAKGRRLLFVPTTWGAFEAAESLDELVAHPPRPIADDPLYEMIQQQIAGKSGIASPDEPHQKRLFEAEVAEYDALDW